MYVSQLNLYIYIYILLLYRLTWDAVGQCVPTDMEVLAKLGRVAVRLSPLGKITVSQLRGRR